MEEWSYFTQGEEGAFRSNFLAYSLLVSTFLKEGQALKINEDLISRNDYWGVFMEYIKGVKKIMDKNFKEAEEILASSIKRSDFEIFAFSYFLAKILDEDFDYKEFKDYINLNKSKHPAFDLIEAIYLKDISKSREKFFEIENQAPHTLDFAIYYSLIKRVKEIYPEILGFL